MSSLDLRREKNRFFHSHVGTLIATKSGFFVALGSPMGPFLNYLLTCTVVQKSLVDLIRIRLKS